MLNEEQIEEILQALNSLPLEKVAEARDFIMFLQAQNKRNFHLDESDVWTDEDLRDVSSASLMNAEGSFPELKKK